MASRRPAHIGGSLIINGRRYTFGSGTAGGLPPIPYGDFPITPNEMGSWGKAHGAIGINHNSIWDPMLGRNREGIEIHSAGARNAMCNTSGCVALPHQQFVDLKSQIRSMIKQNGVAYLHVGPQGIIVNTLPSSSTADFASANATAKDAGGKATSTAEAITKGAGRVPGALGLPGKIANVAIGLGAGIHSRKEAQRFAQTNIKKAIPVSTDAPAGVEPTPIPGANEGPSPAPTGVIPGSDIPFYGGTTPGSTPPPYDIPFSQPPSIPNNIPAYQEASAPGSADMNFPGSQSYGTYGNSAYADQLLAQPSGGPPDYMFGAGSPASSPSSDMINITGSTDQFSGMMSPSAFENVASPVDYFGIPSGSFASELMLPSGGPADYMFGTGSAAAQQASSYGSPSSTYGSFALSNGLGYSPVTGLQLGGYSPASYPGLSLSGSSPSATQTYSGAGLASPGLTSYDPISQSVGGTDIASFGGDLSATAVMGYAPAPGQNTYDAGDGTTYVYDSDWNYLYTQTTPSGSSGAGAAPSTSGSGSSSSVSQPTPFNPNAPISGGVSGPQGYLYGIDPLTGQPIYNANGYATGPNPNYTPFAGGPGAGPQFSPGINPNNPTGPAGPQLGYGMAGYSSGAYGSLMSAALGSPGLFGSAGGMAGGGPNRGSDYVREGGVIPGVDHGYDEVPAILQPGEVVVNKKQLAGLKIGDASKLRKDQINAIRKAKKKAA